MVERTFPKGLSIAMNDEGVKCRPSGEHHGRGECDVGALFCLDTAIAGRPASLTGRAPGQSAESPRPTGFRATRLVGAQVLDPHLCR